MPAIWWNIGQIITFHWRSASLQKSEPSNDILIQPLASKSTSKADKQYIQIGCSRPMAISQTKLVLFCFKSLFHAKTLHLSCESNAPLPPFKFIAALRIEASKLKPEEAPEMTRFGLLCLVFLGLGLRSWKLFQVMWGQQKTKRTNINVDTNVCSWISDLNWFRFSRPSVLWSMHGRMVLAIDWCLFWLLT